MDELRTKAHEAVDVLCDLLHEFSTVVNAPAEAPAAPSEDEQAETTKDVVAAPAEEPTAPAEQPEVETMPEQVANTPAGVAPSQPLDQSVGQPTPIALGA